MSDQEHRTSKPKPIVIELTAQVLGPGSTTIGSSGHDALWDQVDPWPARIRVGFMDNDKAELLKERRRMGLPTMAGTRAMFAAIDEARGRR